MLKTCKSVLVSSLAVVLIGPQAPAVSSGNLRAVSPVNSQTFDEVSRCRTKIYSVMGPAHLISPDGIRVSVPMLDADAARARGYRDDLEAVKQQAQEFANGHNKQSEEQALIAKLSDAELTALHSEIAVCTFKLSERLSRNDLVNYGIAMSEIAGARQYRELSHLIVTSDEERVKQYNDLAAKYNNLLGRCSR
jgi:hypothetical protein